MGRDTTGTTASMIYGVGCRASGLGSSVSGCIPNYGGANGIEH